IPTLDEWAGGKSVSLAIVFTDIVDSTATTNSLGDEAMSALLSEHFERSRNLITENGGRWIKNLGDGDLAAFKNVEDALSYARALQADPGARIRLRVAIHIGRVTVSKGDIQQGHTVIFARRIVDAPMDDGTGVIRLSLAAIS